MKEVHNWNYHTLVNCQVSIISKLVHYFIIIKWWNCPCFFSKKVRKEFLKVSKSYAFSNPLTKHPESRFMEATWNIVRNEGTVLYLHISHPWYNRQMTVSSSIYNVQHSPRHWFCQIGTTTAHFKSVQIDSILV